MKDYLEILKEHWGYDSFRPLQREIIESIGSGHDTLGLMPTGGGKSITFQVPALAAEGICLVVTPLIALMKDQVANLRRRGIMAQAIFGGMKARDVMTAYDNCIYGTCKFLYLSPERLATPLFQEKAVQMNVNMIVVDEAHCISQWGYDFRPAYLTIADLRTLLPDVPVLALTATATDITTDDIMSKLKFRENNVFRMSFARPNIAYVVRRTEAKEKQLVHILSCVEGSAIVYVRNRLLTKEISDLLNNLGFSADYFHAGRNQDEKDRVQNNWVEGRTRVIVCTNAFGMGIDKPDVRLVVHMDAPSSLEEYYQEAGRAGRDGKKSYAVLLWHRSDEQRMNRSLDENFPPKEEIINIYNELADFFEIGVGSGAGTIVDFNIWKFCKAFRRSASQVQHSLELLTHAGFINYQEDAKFQPRLMYLLTREQLFGVEDRYPELANVIRATLRLYEGLFMQYTAIDEDEIALMAKETRQSVYEKLKLLARIGVVSYNPERESTIIHWCEDRIDRKYMRIPRMVYEDRMFTMTERLVAVYAYANSTEDCRGQTLQMYFGETDAEPCGQCDICLARKHSNSH